MQSLSDTKEKQSILKALIYDPGYDCSAFQDFMDGLKPNGGQDIDLWTVEELRTAVQRFKEDNLPLVQQNIQLDSEFQNHYLKGNSESQDISNEQKLDKQGLQHISQEVLTKPLVDSERFYSRKMRCLKQELRIAMDPIELSIQIKNYERVPGGIFTSTYITYVIVTEPMQYEVRRRYSDFLWLRDLLIKIYPGKNIPPLPSKSVMKNQDDLYLNKRMQFLQRFLSTLLTIEVLRHDRWLVAFISMKGDKDFKHVQKLSESMDKINKLDQLITMSGQIDLSINDSLNDYNREGATLLIQIDMLYKKLRRESKQLLLDFDQISNTIFNMGETCTSIYQSTNKFNQSISIGKIPQIDLMFVTMNNMFVQWGNNLTLQIKLVQDDLSNFFKFCHHQVSSLREFMKSKDQASYEYERFKQKLDLKKLKLFQSQDYGRWEVAPQQIKSLQESQLISNYEVCMALMLPKETTILEDLKNVYAFYNNQVHLELSEFLQGTVNALGSHYAKFCNEQKHLLAEVSKSICISKSKCGINLSSIQ